MTNVTSGQKRSWDGSENEANKRPRDRDEPKDWRDVHLKSPRPPPVRQHNERRSPGRGRGGDSGGSRRRNGDHSRRANDSRGKHAKEASKIERRKDERDRSRSTSRRQRSRSRSVEDEKEEGEISPRHSRSPSLPPKEDMPVTQTQKMEQLPSAPRDMELDIPASPPPVEDVLAARRAKRLAILAKYAGAASVGTSVSPSPGPSSAVQPPTPSLFVSNLQSQTHSANGLASPINVDRPMETENPSKRDSVSVSPTPHDFTLAKDGEGEGEPTGGDQVSAADYDPSLDRREDEHKRFGDKPPIDEEVEIEDEDDVDDMFAVASSNKTVKKAKKLVKKPTAPALITTSTLDSAADPEGYYSVILGEQLDGGRYQVFSSLGKGMFANVVRARTLQAEVGEVGREVAIKIIRCQESMYRAGLKEVQILNKLKQADPEDKKHIVRLERTFEHRGHLCLVFESLSMNLREVVKRFGKDVGLNIRAVRAYAHQLFLSMSLLRKMNIMHADIKPDNILVNEHKTMLKLCDLGSASDASENDITPYLVSRFYRAPEIILGVPYDPSLDIWSMGCTLFELYTGKILFPGRSNNHMLHLMMELKGRFNSKMIKKAKFGEVYFDEMGGFESVEKDRVTGNDVVRKVHISKPTRDLRTRLMPPASVKLNDEENKMILNFIDLLDKCLTLDPSRRITPREALAHPFIRG
ncbi:kinase-like domain-containing protein [Crassisporium funariophilum]|nr:kinase-like domain-containing protein [Crassisporium funariophilum]